MNLIVSGEKKTFADGITVRELIQIENVETPEYVTVSLNDEFDEKAAFRVNPVKRRRCGGIYLFSGMRFVKMA